MFPSYDRYSAKKYEGKLFAEIGIFPHSALLLTLQGGRQKGFNKIYRNDWAKASIGLRFSLELEEITFGIEGTYSYGHFSGGENFLRSKGRHYLAPSLIIGKDWFFHNSINIYVTYSLGFERNWEQDNKYLVLMNSVLGIKLLEHLIGRQVIFLNEIIVKINPHRQKIRQVEEYQLQTSIVIFPITNYGVELGYRETLVGKNIHRSQAIFTKLWLNF